MVKRNALLPLGTALALALAAAGCSSRGVIDLAPESVQVLNHPAAPFLSLALSPGSLCAVFADPSMTTLDMTVIPEGDHLPATAPEPEVIDKIDIAAPLSPFFGEHVLASRGGRLAVLYLDHRSDTKDVLKLASRSLEATEWNLDVLEPAGDPLCLQPDASGSFAAAWTDGTVTWRDPSGVMGAPTPPITLHLGNRPAADGSGGAVAFDTASSTLQYLRWDGAGFSSRSVPQAGPVSACLRSPSGRLNVLSWDQARRRLFLLTETGGHDRFARETVTVCSGTDAVALLPGPTESTFLFLFDEVRSVRSGRVVSQLSLIAPGSVLGTGGPRYRKAVVTSGEDRIDGFAAARTSHALYVLVSQGKLRLLRVPLSP